MTLTKATILTLNLVLASFSLQAQEYNPSFFDRNAGAIADLASTYNFAKGGWPEKNKIYNKACGYNSTFRGLNVKTGEYNRAAKKFTLCAAVVRLTLGESVRYVVLSRLEGKERQVAARQFDKGANAIGFGIACRNLSLTKSRENNFGIANSGKANRAAVACAGLYLLAKNEKVTKGLGLNFKSKSRNRKFVTRFFLNF